jgi:uncharacterized protein (TIGR02246 family)
MGTAGPSSTPPSSTTSHGSDEAAIRAVHAAWVAATRERNIQGILDLITDDCVFLVPSAPPIAGKDSVRQMYAQLFVRYGNAKIELQSEIQEIQVFGDTAFWRGTDSIIAAPQDGPPIKSTGYGMGLLRRGVEGKWRFARGINNRVGGN